MTTISQMIGQAQYNAGTASTTGGGVEQGRGYVSGSMQNDGYASFGGSVARNTAIGAAAGALAGLPLGMPLIGAGVGAVAGAGSALIRKPVFAASVGDAMKGAMSGVAGGALIGTVTPLGPIGGAAVGAVGGAATGLVNGLVKNVAGGKFAGLSIDAEKTLWGRVSKGLVMGGASGAAVGAGAGLLFGGIGALPGTLIGAGIGAVGGAVYGALTGTVDAATGVKGVTMFGRSGGGISLPSLGGRRPDYDDGGYPGQRPDQRGDMPPIPGWPPSTSPGDEDGGRPDQSPVQYPCQKGA